MTAADYALVMVFTMSVAGSLLRTICDGIHLFTAGCGETSALVVFDALRFPGAFGFTATIAVVSIMFVAGPHWDEGVWVPAILAGLLTLANWAIPRKIPTRGQLADWEVAQVRADEVQKAIGVLGGFQGVSPDDPMRSQDVLEQAVEALKARMVRLTRDGEVRCGSIFVTSSALRR